VVCGNQAVPKDRDILRNDLVPLRLSASFAFMSEPRSKRGTYIEAFENKVTEIIPRYKSEGVRGGWGELHGQLNVSSRILLIFVSIRQAGCVVPIVNLKT